jgi:uncharacterized protein
MSPDTLLFVGGAFFAALAAGLAGFAFALVASAIWLHFLPPTEAVPLIVTAGLAIHLFSMIQLRGIIMLDLLLPFLVGGIVGVPLGALVLKYADPDHFRLGVGVLMVAYSSFMLLHRPVPQFAGGGRLADGTVGLAGGVLGGAAGLSGVLPTIWCDLRGWPKDHQRGVYQPFILVMHALTVAVLGISGFFNERVWHLFLLATPALLIGCLLGVRLYRQATAQQFRMILLAMIGCSGLSMVV